LRLAAVPEVPPSCPRAGAELAPTRCPPAPELAPSQAHTWPARAPAAARSSPRRLAMLDLCSGSGSASRAADVRGWRVLRVDSAPGTAADVRADVCSWSPPPGPWDLVWASPPCDGFSTARTDGGRDCDLTLVRACLRVIEEAQPRWWVLENVHGATRAIGQLLGPPVARYGSFYLWGRFPPFTADAPRNKTRMSGRRRAERRAAIPWSIAEGLTRACEVLARELSSPPPDDQ
jgi:hypothetical protein